MIPLADQTPRMGKTHFRVFDRQPTDFLAVRHKRREAAAADQIRPCVAQIRDCPSLDSREIDSFFAIVRDMDNIPPAIVKRK